MKNKTTFVALLFIFELILYLRLYFEISNEKYFI